MKMKKQKKMKGSALLSSILVLTTTLIFLNLYQEVYQDRAENNLMLIELKLESTK